MALPPLHASDTATGTATTGGSWLPTITVTDTTYTNTTTFNWQVSSPIIITDAGDQSNNIGNSVSLQVQAIDTVSGTLTYTATGLPTGLSIGSTTGTITGTVGTGASTTTPYTTTITVGDGTNSAVDTFTWTIGQAGPVIVTYPGSQTNIAGDEIALQVQATDTNYKALLYSASSLPAGLSINPLTGLIFGTIASSAVSGTPYSVTVTATDSASSSASQTLSWTVSAAGTVTMVNPGDQSNNEGDTVSLAVSASDSSSGTLRYVAYGLPAGLALNSSTGAITGTLALGTAASGPYTVTVVANDGTYSASQVFAWNITSPISLTAPADRANNENDTVSLSLTATDSSSGTLSYAALGLPPGLKINPTTGAITGTVTRGAWANGPYSVTVIAQDGTYLTSQTFTWTINSPIAIAAPADQSNTDGNTVSLSLSATDSTSGTLKYAALDLPAGLSINASTGAISGTIAVGNSGIASFSPTIIASDGTYSDSISFSWSVSSPVTISGPADQSNTTGDTVYVQIQATDTNSGTLTYTAAGLPTGLVLNTATGLISGTISSGASSIGSFAPTITVSDGTYSTVASFNWSVVAGGTVTMTTPSNQSSVEGATASLSISASDSSSGTLKYFAVGLPAGLKINPSTGAITGTVALGDAAYGPYAVTVIATDGTYSATETFAWTVTSPVTISTVVAQTNNEADTVSLSISAGDSSSGTLKYSAVGLPPGLKINTGTGAITGTVALYAAAAGQYTVAVTAGDGTYSTTQTFLWTIIGPITIATVANQTNTEGNTVSLSISATDTSSGTLRYSEVGLPSGLQINTTTGTITGTIAAGARAGGPCSVTVIASDGTYIASQTFTWKVSSPIFITDPGIQTYHQGSSVHLQVYASHPSSGTLTYSAFGLPTGVSINSGTGLVSGTIGASTDAAGNFNLNIIVSDGIYSQDCTSVFSVEAPSFELVTEYLGGSQAGTADPDKPVPLVTIKVTDQGKSEDLSGFGNGKIDVSAGPAGTVSVATGVKIEAKLPDETEFRKTIGDNWIQIKYKPTNTVTTEKMTYVQFVWFQVQETKGTTTTTAGIPKGGGFTEDQIDTNGGPALVSRDPASPIWIVDRAEGKKSISFIDTYPFATRGDELLAIYDLPLPGQVASIARVRAMVAQTAKDVTEWTATMHFVTYLVYDKKPIYKLSWTATSSITATGKDAGPTTYKLEGAKQVTSLDAALIAVLGKPEYKDQKQLTLP